MDLRELLEAGAAQGCGPSWRTGMEWPDHLDEAGATDVERGRLGDLDDARNAGPDPADD